MCLNSGGGNDNGQFFFKKLLEGGKWQRRENDRGYYGNSKSIKLKLTDIAYDWFD